MPNPTPTPTPTPTRRRRPRPLGRNALAVYATSLALFASVFGFLGLRVAQGQDPSLGSLSAQVTPSAGTPSQHKTAPLRTSTSGGSPSTSTTAQTASAAQSGVQLPGGSRHDD